MRECNPCQSYQNKVTFNPEETSVYILAAYLIEQYNIIYKDKKAAHNLQAMKISFLLSEVNNRLGGIIPGLNRKFGNYSFEYHAGVHQTYSDWVNMSYDPDNEDHFYCDHHYKPQPLLSIKPDFTVEPIEYAPKYALLHPVIKQVCQEVCRDMPENGWRLVANRMGYKG